MLRRRPAARLTGAPDGPARPHADGAARAAGRGEPTHPPPTRSAPRPRGVAALTRGHAVPRNQPTVLAWQGAHVSYQTMYHRQAEMDRHQYYWRTPAHASP